MIKPFIEFCWVDRETGAAQASVSFTAEEWDLAWTRWSRLPEDVRRRLLASEIQIERVALADLADLAAG